VGVRILAFPAELRVRVNETLLAEFPDWTPAPFREPELGFKYYGLTPVSPTITAEYQILPSLVGMFWDLEHSAIYKPMPAFAGLREHLDLKEKRARSLQALMDFETEFAKALSELDTSG
jgi:hypothetical protein